MEIQWTLLFFTLFVGLGAGVFAYTALAEFRGGSKNSRLIGAIIALVALGIGGIASYFHLGHPERLFHILGNVNSSISQELILAVITGAVFVVYIYLVWRDAPENTRKILAGIGLVMSVLMAATTGKIYYLSARPAWHTWLLPLIYLSSASVMGIFATWLYESSSGDKQVKARTRQVAKITLLIQFVLILAYIIFLAMSPLPDDTRSPLRLLSGDLASLFWIGVIILGLIIPAALAFGIKPLESQKLSPVLVGVLGFASVFAGGIAIRAIMYMLGTSVEKFL